MTGGSTLEHQTRALAFDFGASSGRAILGTFDGEKIRMEEVHRFSNDPVEIRGTLYWDVLRQFYEIKQGLLKAKQHGGFNTVAIDTWGVDFGLLDGDGCLLENPVHYRDGRTRGMIEESFQSIPQEEFYRLTGIQFMELNTVFQLMALKRQRPALLERAKTLLFMPDLFNYLLTGEKRTEYTIASTSQLMDAQTGGWSDEVLDRLGLPKEILTPIVLPGTVVGPLDEAMREELGLNSAQVVTVASHDTQSAIAAVPTQEKDFIFISCGTWSLFGTELEAPLINETSAAMNITNERGVEGTTTFLKNIIGLWLIQESRRQWQREGQDFSYAELEKQALAAKPFQCFIDPDAPEFVPQGNLPRRVREFCEKTGQYIPQTVGEIMRCIYESLALKYRLAFKEIRSCTQRDYQEIHVVGGGTKDRLLCQMTADACGVPVLAGPVEATVLGNLAVQLIACGAIENVRQARKIIAQSEAVTPYSPKDTQSWDAVYDQFQHYIVT